MTDPTPPQQLKLVREAIQQMAVVAEYAHPIVFMHIQRVRGYAELLARAAGLAEPEAETLADACQLHDVGMVAVPASIVQKTANLTNEEWGLIKQHPTIGYRILSQASSEVFQVAAQVALTHHERWDGSGYPHGLKGEQIPLAGRICGLCDVFDTLTHPVAYRKAQSPDEVLLLLQESSETFFDPRLVEYFTLQYPDILAVRERFKTPA